MEKDQAKKTIKENKPKIAGAKAGKGPGSNADPNNANAGNGGKKLFGIILLRGLINIRGDILATLFDLRLRKKHACVVLEDTPLIRRTAMKIKDYVASGEITGDTYALLVEKRGKKDETGKLKKYFMLHPPRGGFERKGIKISFTNGGALGYRGAKMNDLIKKML